MTTEHPIHAFVEKRLGEENLAVKAFFREHESRVIPAVYTSADVRHAGFKAASVDANAFPAGFNNLCPQSRAAATRELRRYFDERHPETTRVLLLPEDHTRNPYYLENVLYLSDILAETGIPHCVGSENAEVVEGIKTLETPDGRTTTYCPVWWDGDQLMAGDGKVDFVFSNNDFTGGPPDFVKRLEGSDIPVRPLPDMGWDHRSKGRHFLLYNHLATELAERIGLDPWFLTVDTTIVDGLDFKGRDGLERVAAAVDATVERTKAKYAEHGITGIEPKVFVKDDAGTYGMGMVVASSGEDILKLNNRGRQKMDKGKYGHKVDRVIVQEAIPTTEAVDGHAAEPVIYMIRGRPIGAFMRIHPDKGDADNLNQPGMRFQPICQHRGCHDPGKERIDICLPDVEHVAAELAALALAYEASPEVLGAVKDEDVPMPTLQKAV